MQVGFDPAPVGHLRCTEKPFVSLQNHGISRPAFILDVIGNVSVVPTMAGVASMLYTRFDTSHLVCSSGVDRCARG